MELFLYTGMEITKLYIVISSERTITNQWVRQIKDVNSFANISKTLTHSQNLKTSISGLNICQ